ncbi:MAG: cysteine dioxygenase family protein [Pseudomonadota bacterium]
MSALHARREAIRNTLEHVRSALASGPSENALADAHDYTLALAGRRELFPREDFPLPEGGSTERTFLIHEDDGGGYALYVNSGLPGQTYRPHNHGGAWAIVVAVEGDERHRVYRRVDDGSEDGRGEVEVIEEIDVTPGSGICLAEDGIHSIHALGAEPLLHLHLYGKGFAHQAQRTEFDMEAGTTHAFKITRLDFIEDAR